MKWVIALVFALVCCWVGWQWAPGAMGTWTSVAGLPITGNMVVFVLGLVIVAKAKR